MIFYFGSVGFCFGRVSLIVGSGLSRGLSFDWVWLGYIWFGLNSIGFLVQVGSINRSGSGWRLVLVGLYL